MQYWCFILNADHNHNHTFTAIDQTKNIVLSLCLDKGFEPVYMTSMLQHVIFDCYTNDTRGIQMLQITVYQLQK